MSRLNNRLNVVSDADIGPDDWAAAMSDPTLVDSALVLYDSPDVPDDERALLLELLFNTFEFCSMEREGNPDWRRTLDRVERDFELHEGTVRSWAEPDDGNPWLISAALKSILARRGSRK